jgi:adenylate kinase family enzyme
MKNIVLIGGPGTGKSTLADAIVLQKPEINKIYVSKYVVRIPMTIFDGSPRVLKEIKKLPKETAKEKYINMIINNQYIDLNEFSRYEMDTYGKFIIDLLGETVNAEILERVVKKDKQNLLDNVFRYANIEYLRDKGFYVVRLKCRFKTESERRFNNNKQSDPSTRSELEMCLRNTIDFSEIEKTKDLADITYDTDIWSLDSYPYMAKEILQKTI